jgi:hypothetical protein
MAASMAVSRTFTASLTHARTALETVLLLVVTGVVEAVWAKAGETDKAPNIAATKATRMRVLFMFIFSDFFDLFC